jgi:hypothetical protein
LTDRSLNSVATELPIGTNDRQFLDPFSPRFRHFFVPEIAIDDRIMFQVNKNHRRRMISLLLAAASSGIVTNGQEDGA